MSDTHRHKHQRMLKAAIVERKRKLLGDNIGSTLLAIPLSIYSDDELQDAVGEFWSGPLRHGNKRKYEAGMKVKNRRSKRQKLKEELRDDIGSLA